MATAQTKAAPWLLIGAGVFMAVCVMLLMHDSHYRERRLQLLEHEVEGLKNMLTGRHGRTA